MSEDDEPHEFDLSAWQAPPPPVDLADAVIARAREGAPALEAVEPPRMASRARQRLIGGAAVVALAVAAVLMIWLGPGANHETAGLATLPVGDGSSSGSNARKLELPGAIVTLDPGADITWHRSAGDLVVSQRAGNATWQIDGSHRLVLDTGAVGASVEATGASLRVEVPMNLMDKRVLAGSAISAAVVAFATVTVYEGHVKTTTPTRTLIVKPGVEIALTDDAPTVVLKPSDGVTTSVAGMGDSPSGYTNVLANALSPNNDDLANCSIQFHSPPKVSFDVAIDHSGVAAVTPRDGTDPELGACIAKVITTITQREHIHDATVRFGWDSTSKSVSGPVWPAPAPPVGIHEPTDTNVKVTVPNKHDLEACTTRFHPQSRAAYNVVIDHSGVASITPEAGADAKLGDCIAKVFTTVAQRDHMHDVNMEFSWDPAQMTSHTVACDAKALAEQGRQKLAATDHVGALKALADSLDCMDDASLYPTAYLAACAAGDQNAAKHYFNLFTSTRQTQLLPICLRAGVDPRATACDATALAEKGRQELGINAYAQALQDIEASVKCTDDPSLYASAYMAACMATNSAKAKHWFSKLPAERRTALAQVCLRAGIDPR